MNGPQTLMPKLKRRDNVLLSVSITQASCVCAARVNGTKTFIYLNSARGLFKSSNYSNIALGYIWDSLSSGILIQQGLVFSLSKLDSISGQVKSSQITRPSNVWRETLQIELVRLTKHNILQPYSFYLFVKRLQIHFF